MLSDSSSPPGYNAWLTRASTFGTITSKERNAVLGVFNALNAANMFTRMYQLYLLGGDDAAFGTTASRLGKRGLNVINPAGTALTYVSSNPALAATSLQWGASAYGNSGVALSGLSVVESNFGFTEYNLDVTASVENSTGFSGANITISKSAAGFIDFWGNPPNGVGDTVNAGVLTSISTTASGTGLKTYRNGSLIGTGVNGTAIPSLASAVFTISYSPAAGGNPYAGRIAAAATHQALNATEAAALSSALIAYQAAML